MTTTNKHVKACLFDMDGLLINTEDLYTVAHNSMLAEHGKGPMPWSVKITLMGLPGTESAKRFLEWSGLPYTPEEYYQETTRRLEELFPTAQFLPGARELLTHLDSRGVPIALATSSHAHTFRLKTGHLHDAGFAFFKDHIVTGDDKRVAPGRGKPHPDIWLVALDSLNKEMLENHEEKEPIKIEECLVFEDGVPGVTAGIAAGATVVWVPDERAIDAMGRDKAEELISGHGEMLKSLKELDLAKYGL